MEEAHQHPVAAGLEELGGFLQGLDDPRRGRAEPEGFRCVTMFVAQGYSGRGRRRLRPQRRRDEEQRHEYSPYKVVHQWPWVFMLQHLRLYIKRHGPSRV